MALAAQLAANLEAIGERLGRALVTPPPQRRQGRRIDWAPPRRSSPARDVGTVPPLEKPPIAEGDVAEHLELAFGPGGFGALDSDDIDELVAVGAVWLPGRAAPDSDGEGEGDADGDGDSNR